MSDGGWGISTRGEHFYCSVVKTLKTNKQTKSTRTDTEGSSLAALWPHRIQASAALLPPALLTSPAPPPPSSKTPHSAHVEKDHVFVFCCCFFSPNANSELIREFKEGGTLQCGKQATTKEMKRRNSFGSNPTLTKLVRSVFCLFF